MFSVSVSAVYDREQVRLLEAAPVKGPYHVRVTFEPVSEQGAPGVPARFWGFFGAWQDDWPVEETLRDIHRARRSRIVPPDL